MTPLKVMRCRLFQLYFTLYVIFKGIHDVFINIVFLILLCMSALSGGRAFVQNLSCIHQYPGHMCGISVLDYLSYRTLICKGSDVRRVDRYSYKARASRGVHRISRYYREKKAVGKNYFENFIHRDS